MDGTLAAAGLVRGADRFRALRGLDADLGAGTVAADPRLLMLLLPMPGLLVPSGSSTWPRSVPTSQASFWC
ncbi:hypothetical protein UA74_27650 [Actinoalloteichus fjordicus]|uniref:Uncharacterized protein n=1 Tax=Actinoalloteichus fjordicus TaxID=1612552 RepID=A0AAC9LGT4_9PSEU|nr:hypothetical protein UA74_27650 [Actinoalloteichus fjordicus]